jgi:hypothetical protein
VVTDFYQHIKVNAIRGKCFVLPSGEKPSNRDPRIFQCDSEPLTCNACLKAKLAEVEVEQTLLSFSKLPAIDLYSGAGGAILGAKDLFESKIAVDFEPITCDTLRWVLSLPIGQIRATN